MAAGFVFAVAAQGEVRLVRERGKKIERSGGVGTVKLGPEFPLELIPRALIVRREGGGNELGAGRENGEPNVVEITLGELGFWDAARRTANGSQAEAFAAISGRA